ncbi:hypothetical protein NDU88_001913 [Pleurodeles waltl]|uniref:Secreted protein n=1 Tax=Pleurodeles waltl TaxID=8319 RepID=A0AAV7VD98_PLEWA|nr:hypothetical protein NDU88_001913 [Pleurodeles waltl]
MLPVLALVQVLPVVEGGTSLRRLASGDAAVDSSDGSGGKGGGAGGGACSGDFGGGGHGEGGGAVSSDGAHQELTCSL